VELAVVAGVPLIKENEFVVAKLSFWLGILPFQADDDDDVIALIVVEGVVVVDDEPVSYEDDDAPADMLDKYEDVLPEFTNVSWGFVDELGDQLVMENDLVDSTFSFLLGILPFHDVVVDDDDVIDAVAGFVVDEEYVLLLLL
jgi:hypothetical protein